ncbi:caspase family protein [Aeromonas veronii]|uniref:caspase family protein n=1 Tax=Aeromonas veronii TaxID=654 RepID=UPI001F3A89D7|nr:caspase family protein [Aeromonas veronii]MCF5852748.1 caspase family protein [Aeromonas veronii]
MKKAFVIGNDSYQDNKDKLSNAINDAKAIKDILSYKGFDVFYYGDLSENDFIRAFSDFVDTVCEGDDIIFFFAGHAIEDRDTNYLFSIDYKVSFNLESSLTIDKIQNDFFEKNKSGFKLIVVDACRNNPVCAVSPIPKKIKQITIH